MAIKLPASSDGLRSINAALSDTQDSLAHPYSRPAYLSAFRIPKPDAKARIPSHAVNHRKTSTNLTTCDQCAHRPNYAEQILGQFIPPADALLGIAVRRILRDFRVVSF